MDLHQNQPKEPENSGQGGCNWRDDLLNQSFTSWAKNLDLDDLNEHANYDQNVDDNDEDKIYQDQVVEMDKK